MKIEFGVTNIVVILQLRMRLTELLPLLRPFSKGNFLVVVCFKKHKALSVEKERALLNFSGISRYNLVFFNRGIFLKRAVIAVETINTVLCH